MGLFDRLTRLIRSNLNDLIARAENPEKMLTQIIEDMRRQLAQAKQEVAVAIADERKLRAQVEEEHRQAVDWEKRARLAVRENRDDLAKQALLRAQEHANHAQELQTQWERHRAPPRGHGAAQGLSPPAEREDRGGEAKEESAHREAEAGAGTAAHP
jgi:phage shock protein A